MKQTFLLIAAVLHTLFLAGQNRQSEVPTTTKDSTEKAETNLLESFKQGQFKGNFRTFFMVTDNARQLSDYYALAAGGGLQFSSAPWHGFNFGISGMFNYNLGSSDLSALDSITGARNRYEIGLFDVENPKNRNDLDRMEEFFLRYSYKNSRFTFGKQSIQTPFINSQDGRLRPTAEAGIWLKSGDVKKAKIEGGWLWKISPRSTVGWYTIGESIGLYPKGLNPDGTGSGYPQNLKSKGVALAGITKQWGKHTKVQVWDQYVDNIFNTAFVQADYVWPFKHQNSLLLGIQFTRQDAVADGGNKESAKTYFNKNGYSNAVSGQAGWQHDRWQIIAAYTYVTNEGRFLAPREWGREPFYTFMSRERIEGSGNSRSITGKVRWLSLNKKWRIETGYGHFYLPDVKEVSLNKYAFPSFSQFNFDVRYTFSRMLNGLTGQLLYVRKGRLGDVYGSEKYVINKVGLSHFNIILNYTY